MSETKSQSPEPSTAPDSVSPKPQAMKSAVPVGGPDDAAPTSEMAGLAIKDGAARSDEEGDGPTAKESSAEGHHGRPSNYKTRMCMKWQQHSECSFGNKCNFAHGNDELRNGGATPSASSGGMVSHANPDGKEHHHHHQQMMMQQALHQQQMQNEQHQHQHQIHQQHRGRGPSENRMQGSPWNRKTRLCTKWCNTGVCPYGDRCNFAHGHHELKAQHLGGNNNRWEEEVIVQQQTMAGMNGMLAMGTMMPAMHAMPMMAGAQGNPKNGNYKTRICLNWHKTGGCQYAARCNFAHGQQELRPHFKEMSMDNKGFARGGMHGHAHYHQMGHVNGNGNMAHMQQTMGGPGVGGMHMQAFNNMMMAQMPLQAMQGMPDGMPSMGNMMMGPGMMPMMMDMSMEQMNHHAMAGHPHQRSRGGQRPDIQMLANMQMGGGPGVPHGGLMMVSPVTNGVGIGIPVITVDVAGAPGEEAAADKKKKTEALPQEAAPVA
mmetsp:Transcript_64879/g.105053  ORF Transcript_64879/g.105053 Transcript_64879/m.105053 type:complete len:488 (-) Transcript_64879:436-1899(-)